MVEHRLAGPGGVLRRASDPTDSPDPVVRELVATLRDLPVSPPLRPAFRAELRAQLVAVAPRLVSEGMEGLVRHTPESLATAHLDPSSPLRKLAGRVPRVRLGLSIRVATAALAVAVLMLSGAVWLSRGALPGDALYNLKRASENAQISLASGTGKASDLLAFARTRVDEVADLLSVPSATGSGPQADGGVSSRTASLVTSTLGSADDDVRQASALLGTRVVRDGSAKPLAVMLRWSPGQQARLERIARRVPAGALHDRVTRSAELVARAHARAEALSADATCGCLASSGSDALGPLPCSSCTASPAVTPATPGAGTTPAQPQIQRPGSGQQPATTAPPAHTTKPVTGPGRQVTSHPGTARSSRGGTATPPVQLPTLPSPTPPQPTPSTGQSTCDIGITLGPIKVGAGRCGVRLGF